MSASLITTRGGTEAGAEVRFQALFDRYHLEVFRYCLRRLDRFDAEDAAAEVFAVAWRRLDSIPEGDRSRLWLIGVAHKVVGNQYRSRVRRRRLQERMMSLAQPDRPAEAARGEAILAALAALRSADQEILRLATWDGLNNAEIAETLEISENAVAQRLYRARTRLKDRYQAIQPHFEESQS